MIYSLNIVKITHNYCIQTVGCQKKMNFKDLNKRDRFKITINHNTQMTIHKKEGGIH